MKTSGNSLRFFWIFCIELAFLSGHLQAQKMKPPQKTIAALPPPALTTDASSGNLRVAQINSCGTIDKIAWKLKSGGVRTRRIFRDYLTKDGDAGPSLWSLFQVLRDKGEVSFVFERERKDGREEFVAAHGDKLARIMEVKKNKPRRVVRKQDLKPLINRTAVGFVGDDGARVEFIPGQTGRASVILYPTDDAGVGLAPVYLKGISCDKPETFKDDEKTPERATSPTTENSSTGK